MSELNKESVAPFRPSKMVCAVSVLLCCFTSLEFAEGQINAINAFICVLHIIGSSKYIPESSTKFSVSFMLIIFDIINQNCDWKIGKTSDFFTNKRVFVCSFLLYVPLPAG